MQGHLIERDLSPRQGELPACLRER
jgi:hypothetical protein